MAAVDYFLEIKGVEGETHDGQMKSKKAIDVESWSWGVTQGGTGHAGGGHGAGKAIAQDFHFVMKMNKASPKLMQICAKGDHIAEAVLTCRKAGGKQDAFFIVKMTDLMVSSYQTGGSGHSDIVPTDQISLNFAKIEFDYRMQDEKGTLKTTGPAGYDFKLNQKV